MKTRHASVRGSASADHPHPAGERSAASEALREDGEVRRVRGREMRVSHILLGFQLGARK